MIPVLTGCRCITSGSWPAIPLSRLIFVFVALQQICIRMDLLAEKFYHVKNGKAQDLYFVFVVNILNPPLFDVNKWKSKKCKHICSLLITF